MDDYNSQTVSTQGLSETERHRLFSEKRRKITLDVLNHLSLPIYLDQVAENVAKQATCRDIRQIKIQLHHVDLPLMDEYELLSYDEETKRIDIPENRHLVK